MSATQAQHHINWFSQARLPGGMIEQSFGSRKKEKAFLTREDAFRILQMSKSQILKYDQSTTEMEMKTCDLFSMFHLLSRPEKRHLLKVIKNGADTKQKQFLHAIDMFRRVEKSEMWKPHYFLLQPHKELSLQVYGRAAAFSKSVLDELLRETEEKPTFSYNLEKMKTAMASDFSVVPASVKSFEDFDKWMLES
ncbi:hypothetical protein Q0A17_04295 [Citrobacter sp. S2-9]|uniref:Uncharacterized protein n=1 Tax=Citrobacter enshiensis TaxID=2971264 RepID=A0ABT8PQP0_9ENTR|nr:hypothetical protein [Citrobacter enshiensis]MDN8598643.1 hypothetical protein [Citrobacter enshiensis]